MRLAVSVLRRHLLLDLVAWALCEVGDAELVSICEGEKAFGGWMGQGACGERLPQVKPGTGGGDASFLKEVGPEGSPVPFRVAHLQFRLPRCWGVTLPARVRVCPESPEFC